jgi:uncharacterized membrane protein AbrB (regulator of aidB expression)
VTAARPTANKIGDRFADTAFAHIRTEAPALGIVYRLIVLSIAGGIAIWLKRKRGMSWSSALLIGVIVTIGLLVLGEIIRI